MNAIVHQSIRTNSVALELRTYEFKKLHDNVFVYDKHWFVEFALSPRPGSARGRYEDLWSPDRVEQIGEILCVPPGLRVRGQCEPGMQSGLACFIDSSILDDVTPKLEGNSFEESLHVRNRTIRQGLLRLLNEMSQAAFSRPLAVDAAATLLAVDLARHLTKASTAAKPLSGGLAPIVMKRIDDRLDSDAPLPTLKELADFCDLSVRHLARAFRQAREETIGTYVQRAGIRRAVRLLRDSPHSVAEIARQLGFASGSSFSATFRKATGYRPSEVRHRGDLRL